MFQSLDVYQQQSTDEQSHNSTDRKCMLRKGYLFFSCTTWHNFGPLVCYITFNSQSEAVIFFFLKRFFQHDKLFKTKRTPGFVTHSYLRCFMQSIKLAMIYFNVEQRYGPTNTPIPRASVEMWLKCGLTGQNLILMTYYHTQRQCHHSPDIPWNLRFSH